MELMTVDEVAEYLKMNPQVIRRWLREKKLPGYKVGREWRIAKEDVDNLIKANKN